MQITNERCVENGEFSATITEFLHYGPISKNPPYKIFKNLLCFNMELAPLNTPSSVRYGQDFRNRYQKCHRDKFWCK
jgi:hypothetical protein